MDRIIVYPGSIPLDTDLLNTNRNTMIGLGALISATLGSTPVIDGLAVVPTAPASLGVMVLPGSITQLAPLDQNAYGSLPADAADSLVKMGVNISPTPFTLAAPTTSGQAITYLIQASFQEADANPVVLPYYNAANPAQPFLGAANSGAAQSTARTQRVQLQLKAGAAAITGSQTAPPVDTGWSGLATIAVGFGQTQITASSIAPLPTAPLIPFRLPSLRPGFSAWQVFSVSGNFIVPAGVSTVRATVIGGGGAGGTNSSYPGGGGGAGGEAIRIVTGLTPGQLIPITVGGGGAAPPLSSPGNGGSGASSSFGVYVSATGGGGGSGGTVALFGGGSGGAGFGGDINIGGSYGSDGSAIATHGGDGGGPGNGRGATSQNNGFSAIGYGGGGGGGGASAPNGTGVGAQGGNGAQGVVIVEF